MFSGVTSIPSRMRVAFAFLVTMILVLSAPLSASAAGMKDGIVSDNSSILTITRAANIVSAISLSPRSPNFLVPHEQISISFRYNTAAIGGVVVTGIPTTGGVPTPSASFCVSATLPVGAGTGTCTISIGTGPATVNGILFQVWPSAQVWSGQSVLFQGLLPVDYQVDAAANFVSGLAFSLQTPNVVQVGKGVSIKFNYTTNQPAGVRIIAIPFTGTAMSLNAITCGATIYTASSGTGTCRFTIGSGALDVTSLHIQMWDANHINMITQEVLPVLYHFRSAATMVLNTSVSPQTPNFVRLGNKVTVHFNYVTNQAGGILVVAIPFAGTTRVAGAALVPSALLPATTTTIGKGSASFSLTGSPIRVTSILIRVWNANRTTLLFAVSLPVNDLFQ